MEKYQKYFDTIESELSKIEYAASPDGLYAPVRYELSLGGKRVRPLLTLLACEMFGGDCRRAVDAAVGLEVFHNFTLLHDDVMDKADVGENLPCTRCGTRIGLSCRAMRWRLSPFAT